jgi:hypothetical protein
LREVKSSLSFHDSTTAVLEASVSFLTTCLERGNGAAVIDTNIFRLAQLPWADLFSLLSFEQRDFFGILSSGDGFHARLDGPLTLKERRDQLMKLLQVYRAEKKGITSAERFQPAKRHRW